MLGVQPCLQQCTHTLNTLPAEELSPLRAGYCSPSVGLSKRRILSDRSRCTFFLPTLLKTRPSWSISRSLNTSRADTPPAVHFRMSSILSSTTSGRTTSLAELDSGWRVSWLWRQQDWMRRINHQRQGEMSRACHNPTQGDMMFNPGHLGTVRDQSNQGTHQPPLRTDTYGKQKLLTEVIDGLLASTGQVMVTLNGHPICSMCSTERNQVRVRTHRSPRGMYVAKGTYCYPQLGSCVILLGWGRRAGARNRSLLDSLPSPMIGSWPCRPQLSAFPA